MIPLSRSLLLATLLTTAASAQTAPRLPTSVDTFTVRYGTTVIGRGIMQRSYRGSELIQVYTWQSVQGGAWSLDSLFLDAATLTTRRDVLVSGDTTRVAAYSPGAVTIGAGRDARGAMARSVAVPEGTQSSAAIEAIAASMPFSVGATRKFSTFYAPPARLGVVETTIRVEAREDVDGRAAWRVSADTPGGGTVFWIDALSRAVLRYDVREDGALITFRR